MIKDVKTNIIIKDFYKDLVTELDKFLKDKTFDYLSLNYSMSTTDYAGTKYSVLITYTLTDPYKGINYP